jgi:hypothetical protein
MKSYVKVLGPPLLAAIRALDGVAVEMKEVSIMNPLIQLAPFDSMTSDETRGYFAELGGITPERAHKIISKSGESLGEYDYYFEWVQRPRFKDVEGLIERIDEAFGPLGCQYTLTTK